MSSRGKKKLGTSAGVQSLSNQNAIKIGKQKNKLNFNFNLILCLGLLVLFIFIMLLPILKVDVTVDASKFSEEMGEEATEGEYKVMSATVSFLDIFIAPLRGIQSGLDYLIEKSDFIAKTDLAKRVFLSLAPVLIGQEVLDKMEDSSVALFVVSVIVIFFLLVSIVTALFERSKNRQKYLFTTISISSLFVVIFALFVVLTSFMISTAKKMSKVSCEWGLWLILVLIIALITYIVYYIINQRKLRKQEEIEHEKVS